MSIKKYTKFIGSFLALAILLSPAVNYAATIKNGIALEAGSSMPVISGIKSPTVLKTGQMGTWTIKAFDSSNGTLSYSVDWGDSPNQFARMMAEPVFVQTSTFTHAYSSPGTYTITFTVENEQGIKTTSTVTVRVRQGEQTNSPLISDFTATSTKPKQATLSWKTDVKSNSNVWFGTTTPVNTSGEAKVIRKAKVLNHKINLTKLEPNTTYYVVIGSSNAGGMSKSSETSFVTPPLVDNKPVITGVVGSTTIAAGETEMVTVNAFDPKNSDLSYSVDWGDSNMMMKAMSLLSDEQPFVQTSTFTHIYSEAGTYTATFKVKNDAGLEAVATLVITVTAPPSDVTAPTISEIATSTDTNSNTITWVTDEPSTSKVFYSTTSSVDLTSTTTPFVFDGLLTTDHSIDLPSLATSTQYYFVVESADVANNTATSSEMNFTTSSGM